MGATTSRKEHVTSTSLSLLILVPARGGSKRLPGKNLRLLAGRSLLAHTAEAIADSGLQAPVVLSTDDDRIAAEGRRIGWRVPFLRPAALARDESPTVGAVLHALDWWRQAYGAEPDAVMVLQPTSPLRGGECLGRAVASLRASPQHDSVIAVNAHHVTAGHVYVPGSIDDMVPITDGDTRQPVFVPNGALYLTRVPALRRENTLYAGAILPLQLSPLRGIDIDTAEDWLVAETLAGALDRAGSTRVRW